MKRKCRYYLVGDDLVEVDFTNGVVISPEQASLISYGELLIEIKLYRGELTLNKYHQLSNNYENQAILMFNRMWMYNENEHINLSTQLIEDVASHVTKSINDVISDYYSFSSEDQITAALAFSLRNKFNDDSSDIGVSFQSYSSVKKEPVNGADLSFIFDINDRQGRRVIKTILIQSKKSVIQP